MSQIRTLQGAALLALSALLTACSGGPNPYRDGYRPPDPDAHLGDTITAEEIASRPRQSVEEILRGRISGVWVTQGPGGALRIRIRGRTTFQGDAEPLFVIDDVPINPGPGGSLVGISPYDIESIEVLKDPADIAMYGIRGANGVILIKLKGPGGGGAAEG